MDAKKMFLALVLIATLAVIPSFATFEKDFISPKAIEAIRKRSAPLSNIMLEEDAINALINTKTIISNPVLEQALFKNIIGPNRNHCFETCRVWGCISSVAGCYCYNEICVTD